MASSRLTLDFGQDCFLKLPDPGFIAFIEGPLFNALPANQATLAEDLQVFTRGGLADPKFLRDEDTAHAVLH